MVHLSIFCLTDGKDARIKIQGQLSPLCWPMTLFLKYTSLYISSRNKEVLKCWPVNVIRLMCTN